MFKNVQVLPFFVEPSQVIRLLPDLQGHLFLFAGSRGQKPTFGSNQTTFGRNHATFVRNQTIIWEQSKYIWEESVKIFIKSPFIPSGLRLRPCLAGLLPDILHSLGAKKNWEEHVNVSEETVTRWEQPKHIWDQSKHTWEQSKHSWEQSNHIWEECVNISTKTHNNPKSCSIAPMPAPYPPKFFTQFGRTKNPFGRRVSISGSNRCRLGSILFKVGSNQNPFGSSLSLLGSIPPFMKRIHTLIPEICIFFGLCMLHLQSNHENGWRSGRIE
jgi:hypothetical protein